MDCTLAAHADLNAWLRLTLVPGVTVDAQRSLLEAFGVS